MPFQLHRFTDRSMCDFLNFTESGIQRKHSTLIITRDIWVINDLSRAPITSNQQANSLVKGEHKAYRFSTLYQTEKQNQKSTSSKESRESEKHVPPPSKLPEPSAPSIQTTKRGHSPNGNIAPSLPFLCIGALV